MPAILTRSRTFGQIPAILIRTHTSKTFRTWKDLILPNGRDTRIFLFEVDEREDPKSAKTSSFTPPEWQPDRLPSHIYVVNDLPSKMEDHLRHLLDEHYAKPAARTRFTKYGTRITPNDVWNNLRMSYLHSPFPLNYEQAKYTSIVAHAVHDIYWALTAKRLSTTEQQRATRGTVIADSVFELNHEIKILWEDKAPKVFDKIIGDLIDEARAHGSVTTPYLQPFEPSSTKRSSTKRSSPKQSSTKQSSSKQSPSKQSSSKRSSTTYNTHEAILGKVRLVAL